MLELIELVLLIRKALVAFDFDEKLTHTKNYGTKNYVISRVKGLSSLYLHFAVDRRLSVPGYDLVNGRMVCRQKY